MKKIWLLLICLMTGLTVFASDQSNSLVDEAWVAWGKNNYKVVEEKLMAAYNSDKNDLRANIGLTLFYQMKKNPETSWKYFRNVLEIEPNYYPYLFALLSTDIISSNFDKSDGDMLSFFEKIGQKADETGIIKGMANENLGRHYQYIIGDFKKSDVYYSKINAIKQWMLAGPFDNISASGFDKVFEPEISYSTSTEMKGKNGVPVTWFQPKAFRRDPWIDFRRYSAASQSIFYANNFVYSPKKQTVQIRVGTSGSVKTFLNDQSIMEVFDENNNDLDTYISETELQEGWNRLLVKVGYSEISSCNFLLRITDSAGENISGLKISIENQPYTSKPSAPVKTIGNFAEEFFQNKVKQNPEQLENYILLADCYLRNDKANEGELILQEAVKKSPNNVLLLNALVEAFIRGEKYDERTTMYEKIYGLDPNNLDAIIFKFYRFLNNEEFDKSDELLQRFGQLKPASDDYYEMAIEFYGRKKDDSKKLATVEYAAKKYPGNFSFVSQYANNVFSNKQDPDQVIDLYEKLLKYRQFENAYLNIGVMYLRKNNWDKFEEYLMKVFDIEAASPGLYYKYATIYQQLQKYDKALEMITKAIEICPYFDDYLELQGDIYRSLKDESNAKKSYQNALKYNPAGYSVREKIRDIDGKKSIFNLFQNNNIDSLITTAPKTEKSSKGVNILLDDIKRVVYDNGSSEMVYELLVKVFNNKGIDDFKEYGIPYNSNTEALIIEKAVVKKASGSEIKADQDGSQVVFKSLEAGDCIYMRWRVKNYYRGKLSDQFWDSFYMNYFYPVSNISYSLLIPESKKFQYKVQNGSFEPTIKTTAEGMIYRWEQKNVPEIQGEIAMPTLNDVGTRLHLSTIPNWEFMVDWYLDLAKTKTRSTFEIKEKVAELLDGKKDISDAEKIKIIYNYITENIRYSFVSFRQSGLIPQSAREVLINKIGDCKDKATLFISMLAEAGIESHYVLLNTVDEGLNHDILPSIEFNHCIAAVETKTGLNFYDLTAYNYPIGTVPNMDMGAFYLLIKPGVKEPGYLPKNGFEERKIIRSSKVVLNTDNSIFTDVKSVRTGSLTASTRENYRGKTQEELEKAFIENNSDLATVKLKSINYGNLDSIGNEIKYNYSYEKPDFASEVGGFKLIKMDWVDDDYNGDYFTYEKRNFDLNYMSSIDNVVEDRIIELPKGYKPTELVKEKKLSCPAADYQMTLKFEKGKIIGKRIFKYKKTIISTSEYAEFKKFMTDVSNSDKTQILLTKGK